MLTLGERIRHFRIKKGVTQKYLGVQIGLSAASAEVRITQYENGSRQPKPDRIIKLANALNISPFALEIPALSTELGFMHTLFVLEDLYGLRPKEISGQLYLHIDTQSSVVEKLRSWNTQHFKLQSGQISHTDYDLWRYCYPRLKP